MQWQGSYASSDPKMQHAFARFFLRNPSFYRIIFAIILLIIQVFAYVTLHICFSKYGNK